MVRSGAALAGLAEIPPGPALAAALAGLELGEVPNNQVIDVLQAQSRQLAHEQARMLTTLVEVSRTTPGVLGPWRREQAYEWASGEISAALTWTARGADRELAFADTVVTRLPQVLVALWDGHIDRAKAWVFADHLDPACALSEQQISAVCAQLLPTAPALSTGELAARLLRAIIAIDPDHARRRYTRAIREREVITYLDREGTVTISAHRLPPPEAAAATERLRALAKAAKRAGHPGRLPQIQADLFCGLLNGRYHGYTHEQIIADLLTHAANDQTEHPERADHAERAEHAPASRRPSPDTAPTTPTAEAASQPTAGDREPRPSNTRAGVEIRVGLPTLLGLDDHPGEIPTLGPVLAPTARTLVAAQTRGARWRFAVTDPEGYLLLAGAIRARPTGTGGGRTAGGIVEIHLPVDLLHDLTTHPANHGPWAHVIREIAQQYRNRDRLLAALDHHPCDRFPHTALARHIEVRDRTCTFMHCRCSARESDLDHTTDHAQGGTTISTNLGPGCGRHHPYKHKLGWRLTQPQPGHFTWISPLGRIYHTRGQPITPPLPPPLRSTRPTDSDHGPRPPPPDDTHDDGSPPF